MNVEPEDIRDEAVLAFYSDDGERRVRMLIAGKEVADLVHDGSMHIELDRLLAQQGLMRRGGFHLSERGLVAQLRKVGDD